MNANSLQQSSQEHNHQAQPKTWEQLETPCIIIDAAKMNANIRTMADIAAKNGVSLRPHAKTHKLPSVAKLQLEAGAVGITVAKVSEAEVMAAGGIGNIFIAYPLVATSKIERAITLSQQIDLILAVDSLEGAQRLSAAAKARNHTLNVRLEIDTGLRRTGVLFENAVQLAKQIHDMEHLQLSGIYTFRGALQNGKATLDRRSAGHEEGELMVRLADQMRGEGVPIVDVSVGSTPTGAYAAEVKGVTEIRPGTYVYQDRMQARLEVCGIDECAGYVLATVVSRPSETLAIIDGGSKTFATDVQPNAEPLLLQGFGHFIEAPDAVLERMSEEHGMVRLTAAHDWKPGDRVRVIPNHICSTVNLHNKVYFADGDRFGETPVLARGMLE
ncbi:alanine racemase [Paenibacillus sp. MBLB4367]|uniref:alanine racemase n=1 Tax=Paenibacillus sp. MBLB4367 TaxID=3384767 RepID=UPI003907FB2B